MKKPLIIIAIVVAIFLGVVAVMALNHKTDNTSTTDTSTTAPTTPTDTTDNGSTDTTTPPASATVITYSNGTFSPSTVTVKAGDTIEVKNNGGELQFNSDPHPSHTDNPELNIGSISAGSTKTIKVSHLGTWGYHNHLDSTETGTIIVQ